MPIAEIDAPRAENDENAVVLSGIDNRFDQLMVQRMEEATENGDTVWLASLQVFAVAGDGCRP